MVDANFVQIIVGSIDLLAFVSVIKDTNCKMENALLLIVVRKETKSGLLMEDVSVKINMLVTGTMIVSKLSLPVLPSKSNPMENVSAKLVTRDRSGGIASLSNVKKMKYFLMMWENA